MRAKQGKKVTQMQQARDHSEAGVGGGVASTVPPYNTLKLSCAHEDILFCVDADRQMDTEMKSTGANGKPLTRIDAIKQAVLLFVHSKLTISPYHRFAFATLGHSAQWLQKEFTNDINIINKTVRSLGADSLYIHSDLTQLLRMAYTEARKSRSHSRLLRVILIYCRSSVVPEFASQWLQSQKIFSLDVVYLHDKPNRDNCPQKVFDALIEAVEHVSEYEGYIFESGTSITRLLFRQMCILLCHPQQRRLQDDLDIPKSLKALNQVEATSSSSSTHKEESGQPRDLLAE